ncbi:ribokinase [Aeromicrobium sp. SORGH_AS981]|uniref:ribokinase n=1 Tax=Aeromicrobium sp. SORGH_AS_0981 TaxID=3041802 RepID=UPI00285B2E35|nr:ribokinase [Aeromicrobium sp. SORGH_AS_0981]MDR6118747.1 ribokinase [Aeromicrobium sp. SORGH_AS_0981]
MTTPSGVLVIGSITADVTTFSQRLPRPGETILGDDLTLVLGGKGANQAVAAALAGVDTQMVGCVGTDAFAELTRGGLAASGVDVTSVRTVDGPTGVAHIRVDASGENDIVMVPLANDHLGLADVDAGVAGAVGRASVLLTQLETPVDVMVRATRAARAAGMVAILDPAPAAPLDDAVWAELDVVTPNETEATTLTGIPVVDVASAEQAGRWFVERGVAHAVVTLAAKGVVVVDADGPRHFAAPAVEAVDTTAAGDAFAGYLGAGLASGLTLDAALPRAMAAGALAVTRRGASPSLPAGTDVDAFLAVRAAGTSTPTATTGS